MAPGHISGPGALLSSTGLTAWSGRRAPCCVVALLAGLGALASPPPARGEAPERTREELYLDACSACHGRGGQGAPASLVGFDTPLPDFTDCSFATREPDTDWLAVTHDGGPTRGFAPMMPAFGGALTDAEIQQTIDHVRGFCTDGGWPRGDLNLPRPMFTEKAYPEDEAVYTVGVTTEEPVAIAHELLYGKRLGDRYMFELVVPFTVLDRGGDEGWTAGLEDIALGLRAVVVHSLEVGSILALTAEAVLPTGDESEGFGSGITVFEPFLSYGQVIPVMGFLQVQAGAVLPVDPDQADLVAFWRAAYGRTFTQGRWGRSWTPIVEVLGERPLTDTGRVAWDIVPQLQVSLNARQNILASAAVRVPLTETAERPVEVLVYLLWDWFDGGLTEGW